MRTKEWNELLEFETRDLVERFIKNQYGRTPTSSKVYDITSNFIQAREYFKSANSADFSVRPLLQYYGVVSLSKGLILSLSPELNETNLKSSHGLSVNNWKEVVKNKNYGDIEIVIGDGIFSELINVTRNLNHLRANSSEVNWQSAMTTPKKGQTFELIKLIQYFPDLNKEYQTWAEESLDYAIVEDLKEDKDGIVLATTRNILNQDVLEKLFPENLCKGRIQNGKTIKYNTCGWYPNITQLWDGGFNVGDACIIPVFKNDIGLNQLAGMYMMSYVLGMMARYYPTTWISIRRVEKGDKIYPFVHRILDYIDDKYPRVVIDFLRNIDKLNKYPNT